MKNNLAILIALIALIMGAYGVLQSKQVTASGVKTETPFESVYDRVMRTRTLRCGYIIYEPAIIRDANTGELSGIVYELVNKIASLQNLEVTWAFESSFGGRIDDLRGDKFDVLCTANWSLAVLGVDAYAVSPMWYSGVGVFVRGDDNRFGSDIAQFNDPAITIATVDGTIPHHVALQDFPLAQVLALPQYSDYSLNLLNVVNNKADVTFIEVNYAAQFVEKNKASLKNLVPEKPIRVYPTSLFIRGGEDRLQEMLNMGISELHSIGFIEKTLRKYEAFPGSFYRVADPYQAAKY